jgi:hypothetical protein
MSKAIKAINTEIKEYKDSIKNDTQELQRLRRARDILTRKVQIRRARTTDRRTETANAKKVAITPLSIRILAEFNGDTPAMTFNDIHNKLWDAKITSLRSALVRLVAKKKLRKTKRGRNVIYRQKVQ